MCVCVCESSSSLTIEEERDLVDYRGFFIVFTLCKVLTVLDFFYKGDIGISPETKFQLFLMITNSVKRKRKNFVSK